MDDLSVARFWAKVNRDAGRDGCWEWTASVTKAGYGRFLFGGKHLIAHQIAYEQLVGQVPKGLELDHLCRNRLCVNPVHLEPVTHRENVLRGSGPTAVNARKTHCKHGHEFTPENTAMTKGGNRACRACWKRPRPKRP